MMAIRVGLHHQTRYRYDRLVRLSPHVVRLRPAPHARTPVTSYALRVLPGEHFINWQQDPQGNHLARLVFPEPARELVIDVATRFSPLGHTPAAVAPITIPAAPEFPLTLDLRRG